MKTHTEHRMSGKSVFHDLSSESEATELEMRAMLLNGPHGLVARLRYDAD